MKISTDAILLGGQATFENPRSILDIGTGTGVISLMLAQRFPNSKITAVEIDEAAAAQARENFRKSPFSERLNLHFGKIQEFDKGPFDLILSNPPYYSDHLKSVDPRRLKALHTDELSFGELLGKVVQMLQPHGQFWVILPRRQMEELINLASKVQLFENQKIRVRDKQESKVLREVAVFSFQVTNPVVRELYLKEPDGTYSEDYRGILSGFLLGY